MPKKSENNKSEKPIQDQGQNAATKIEDKESMKAFFDKSSLKIGSGELKLSLKQSEPDNDYSIEKYASDQLTALAVYDSVSKTFRFKLSGRPPGSLKGGVQGDHVTAFALVRRGFERRLRDVPINEEKDLDTIRKLRDTEVLDQYISRVLIIDESFLVQFKSTLPDVQKRYNIHRFSKEQLQKMRTTNEKLSNNGVLDEEGLEVYQAIYKNAYCVNARFMCDEICDFAKSFLTYYNGIAGGAYYQVPGHEAPKSEGPEVRAALDHLDGKDTEGKLYKDNISTYNELIAKIDGSEYSPENLEVLKSVISQHKSFSKPISSHKKTKRSYSSQVKLVTDELKDSIASEQKSLNAHYSTANKIKHIKNLFFYPRMPDEYVKANPGGGYRKNDPDSFYEAMAKHLIIVFAAYPELTNQQNDITKMFIKECIKDGWSKYIKSSEAYKAVSEEADDLAKKYEPLSKTEIYLESGHHSSREGSDAEDEETQTAAPSTPSSGAAL